VLLAIDLSVSSFSASEHDLLVEYEIAGENAPAFDIGIHRSADGVTPDALVMSHTVSDPSYLQAGTHRIAITADFLDVPEDYYLVAQADACSGLSELDVFSLYSAVHVRVHGGADEVSICSAKSAATPLWGFGGPGEDCLIGGAGDDLLYGGDGRDVVEGRKGSDTMPDASGEDVIHGGDGFDVPEIADDDQAEYESGNAAWDVHSTAGGLENDFRRHASGAGESKATWTFEGLPPEQDYEVFVTWVPSDDCARNAPYRVFDDALVSWPRGDRQR